MALDPRLSLAVLNVGDLQKMDDAHNDALSTRAARDQQTAQSAELQPFRVQGAQQDVQRGRQQLDVGQLDQHAKELAYEAQLLASTTDEPSWQRARGIYAQQFPDRAASLPENYDANWVRSAQQAGLTAAQQIELKRQELTDSRWQQTFDENARHNRVVENQRVDSGANNVTIGNSLVDRRTGNIVRTIPTAPDPNKPLSASQEKAFNSAEDEYNSGNAVISDLTRAIDLNGKAFSGVGSDTLADISRVPVIGGLVPKEGADATVDFKNLILGQALSSLKSTFGAAPTEGERQILLDLQASVDKTADQRKPILERALQAARNRQQNASRRMDGIANRTSFSERAQNTVNAGNAQRAKQIKAAVKAGTLSRDDGIKELQGLGYE